MPGLLREPNCARGSDHDEAFLAAVYMLDLGSRQWGRDNFAKHGFWEGRVMFETA
jgi:hypothetical protein